MELQSIKISQYAGGFVATGYNIQGLSIIDGEQQPNIEDAVNSLLRVMIATEKEYDTRYVLSQVPVTNEYEASLEGMADHNCPWYGRCPVCGHEGSDNDCRGDNL